MRKKYWRYTIMNGTLKTRYWDGHEPINPYKAAQKCPFNLQELSRYARKQGKKIAELTREEVQKFSN